MSLYLLPFGPHYQNVFKHMVKHVYPGRASQGLKETLQTMAPVFWGLACFGLFLPIK